MSEGAKGPRSKTLRIDISTAREGNQFRWLVPYAAVMVTLSLTKSCEPLSALS